MNLKLTILISGGVYALAEVSRLYINQITRVL